MTTHVDIASRLKTLDNKSRLLVEILRSARFRPTTEEHGDLEALSRRLQENTMSISLQIEALNARSVLSEQGGKLISQAESDVNDLIETGQLANRVKFRKNIVLFFEGPKESNLDTAAVKTRKRMTRKRCERISGLNRDGIIAWAVAFSSSVWSSNSMSRNTFEYIAERIEPDRSQAWPPEIFSILRTLGAEEPLNASFKYQEFLKALDNGVNQAKKRKRRNVAKFTSNLAGDVYELAVGDVQEVIKSGRVQGTIRLTETYDISYAPFITIPISRELSDRFATQGPSLI